MVTFQYRCTTKIPKMDLGVGEKGFKFCKNKHPFLMTGVLGVQSRALYFAFSHWFVCSTYCPFFLKFSKVNLTKQWIQNRLFGAVSSGFILLASMLI